MRWNVTSEGPTAGDGHDCRRGFGHRCSERGRSPIGQRPHDLRRGPNPDFLVIAERNIWPNTPFADVNVVHGAVDSETSLGEPVRFRMGTVRP